MSVWVSELLLQELAADVRSVILHTQRLQRLPEASLRQPPADGGWSAVEVVEHLNYYCRYYLPVIEKQMATSHARHQTHFRAGWLGAYFTRIIGPSATGVPARPMQSPADARPAPASQLQPATVLAEFLSHQHHLLNLLAIATSVNLGAVRIPISISRFIRLKLGDTLRFLVAHQQRHFQQIERVLSSVKMESTPSHGQSAQESTVLKPG